MTNPQPDVQNREDRLAQFGRYVDATSGKLKDGVAAAWAEAKKGGHHQKAKFSIRLRRFVNSPTWEKSAKRALKGINAHQDFAPDKDVLAARALTDEDREHFRQLDAEGRLEIKRVHHEMNDEFNQEKQRVMSLFSQDWLTTVVDVGRAGNNLVIRIAEYENQYEWVQQLEGGQAIAEDGRQLKVHADELSVGLGTKLYQLKDKAFVEASFVYNDKLSADEDECDELNQQLLDAALARLEQIEQMAQQLRPHYDQFVQVITQVGAHVTKMTDRTGWEAYAVANLKDDNWDHLITGVDIVLEGIAGAIAEIPFPGAGAAAGVVRAGISKVATVLHMLARDNRIARRQKAVSDTGSGKVDASARRKVYMAALDEDKALMAKLVYENQRANLETVWNGIYVGLAEIPVPGVGKLIKTFCLSVCDGWYRERVDRLEDHLKEQAGQPIESKVVEKWVVEPIKDVGSETIQVAVQAQIANFTAEVVAEIGEAGKAIVDWFTEKAADIFEIGKDIAKEGLETLIAVLIAKVIAKFMTSMAGAMAQAISSGDLQKIIDDSKASAEEAEQALQGLPDPA